MARPLRIQIVGNPDKPGVKAGAASLRQILGAHRDIKVVGVSLSRSGDLSRVGADMFLALGGDGTVLSVCRRLGERQRPVLGIKFGHKGFLAEVLPDELEETGHRLAARHFMVSPRMRVEATLLRRGRSVERLVALNDVVVHSGPLARVIFLDVRVDHELVYSYDADGVILATPTGSTAYSLAAGGPIVAPDLAALVITPICAHTLAARSMVVSASSRVEVRVQSRERTAALTADGQVAAKVLNGDVVRVRRAARPFFLVELGGRQRYQAIRENLHWTPGTKVR
jgi:NAD+ kinase